MFFIFHRSVLSDRPSISFGARLTHRAKKRGSVCWLVSQSACRKINRARRCYSCFDVFCGVCSDDQLSIISLFMFTLHCTFFVSHSIRFFCSMFFFRDPFEFTKLKDRTKPFEQLLCGNCANFFFSWLKRSIVIDVTLGGPRSISNETDWFPQ